MKFDPSPDGKNIREMLGQFMGKRVVFITEDEQKEPMPDPVPLVALHFEDGTMLKFPVPLGFEVYGLETEDS